MGLSYEQFLVAAPLGPVVAALTAVRRGYAIPVGRRTSAVILDEHAHDYKVDSIASRLSRDVEAEVCVATVSDSDVLWLTVVRDGTAVHEYCSAPDHDRKITKDAFGVLRYEDGSRFDPEAPGTPPSGADPAWFLPFGVPEARFDAVAAALADRAADPEDARAGGRHVFAEAIYGDVLAALGFPRGIAFTPFEELDAIAREAVEPEPSYEGLPETFAIAQRHNREHRAARRADFASAYPLGDALPIPPPTPSESTIT